MDWKMRNFFGIRITVSSLLLFMIATVNCFAQLAESHAEGEHESHGRHHAALFLGATARFETDDTDFSLGLDYESRLLPRLGIGLLGEVTFAEDEVFIVGVPILLHPTDKLVLGVAPGFEITDEISEAEHTQTEKETETNFVLRLISSYEFELQPFTFAPVVSLDIVDGETSLVYGISFGKGF